MQTDKERILNKIKTNLGKEKERTSSEKNALEKKIFYAKPNIIPKRGMIAKENLLQIFIERAKEVASSVSIINDLSRVPQEIMEYLVNHNLPSKIVALPNAEIDVIEWEKFPTIEVKKKFADENDETVFVSSFLAIAETGTVVQLSGADNPIPSHFLPDNSIVLIKASRLVASSEDAFKVLRKENKVIPRTVALISGPSRTGDIALNIEMGAHGPRRVHLIVLNDLEE